MRELQQGNLKDRRVHGKGGGQPRHESVQLQKASVLLFIESAGTALQVEI